MESKLVSTISQSYYITQAFKKNMQALRILTVFLLFSAATLRGESPGEVGALAIVDGSVLVDGKPAQEGDSLFPQQTVETEEGRVKMLFIDDTIVDLGPYSSFYIEEYKTNPHRNVSLDLKKGKARTAIHQKLRRDGKFQMKTRSSVLAVRGTEFLCEVRIDGNEVREKFTVADGEVLSRSRLDPAAKPIRLRPGNQVHTFASVKNGQLKQDPSKAENKGEVVTLPASEVQTLISNNSVENKTIETLSRPAAKESKAPPQRSPQSEKNPIPLPKPNVKPKANSLPPQAVIPPPPPGLESGDRSQFDVKVTIRFDPTTTR